MPEFFTFTEDVETQTLNVRLDAGFGPENGESVEKFCIEKINSGIAKIRLDMTVVKMINSRFLGQLLSINTRLLAKSGELTLILNQGSNIESLLKLTRLDQILTIEYFKQPEAATAETGDEQASEE